MDFTMEQRSDGARAEALRQDRRTRLDSTAKRKRFWRHFFHGFWLWFGIVAAMAFVFGTFSLLVINVFLILMIPMFFHREQPSRNYWGWWPGRWF